MEGGPSYLPAFRIILFVVSFETFFLDLRAGVQAESCKVLHLHCLGFWVLTISSLSNETIKMCKNKIKFRALCVVLL
jgi:hypothetical protein